MRKQKNEIEKEELNDKMLDSIVEAMDDIQDHHLQGAESYSELMEILDE